MARRDDPTKPPPLAGDDSASNVTSLADRARRREVQRGLEKARQALADRTWMAEATVELAEHRAVLEELDLDAALPEGDDDEARKGTRSGIRRVRGDDAGARLDMATALARGYAAGDEREMAWLRAYARGEDPPAS